MTLTKQDVEGLIVTRAHMRTVPGCKKKPGYCAKTSREWFARYNFDWSDFLKNGIPAEKLLDTGCALAAALVEHARQVESNQ